MIRNKFLILLVSVTVASFLVSCSQNSDTIETQADNKVTGTIIPTPIVSSMPEVIPTLEPTVTPTSILDNDKTSNDDSLDTYDINVDINYKVILDDDVKDVNPNIIKAVRHAVIDNNVFFAMLKHYIDYSINMDIYIYDVKETGKDNWEVDFWTKEPSDAEYDKSTYQFATVEKEKSGSYIGYIFHSSSLQLGDETY